MGCKRHHHGGYFNIIDILITMRNAAMFTHTNIVAGRECEDDANATVMNLINPSDSVRNRQRKKNLRGLLPEVLTIIAPSIDGVGGFPMRVLCPDRVTSPIAIELTVDNLVYLQTVATAALHDLPATPSPPRPRRKPPSLPKGVVRDTKKQRLLCRVHDAKLGRMRSKTFNLKQFTTETEAEARATEFMSASTPTIIDIDSPSPTTGPIKRVVES